ncbi:hypothetical protein J4454_03425 [Candidatus Pacearchaeota archaeon]|nr:hypothetical protein [Candidatus Pacearchaeota archaeon]
MARFTRKMYVIDSFELEVEAENEEDADDKLREKLRISHLSLRAFLNRKKIECRTAG